MRSSRRSDFVCVAVIVMYAVALSLVWLARVPMFQEPDELTHFDYAAAFFDAGRPFVVPSLRPAHVVTPETRYLASRARFRETRYDLRARFDWSEALGAVALPARDAPKPSGEIPPAGSAFPAIAFSYPAGAYVVIALAMRIAYAAGGSLAVAFFAARAVGVVCLAVNLAFGWLLMRAYGIRRLPALGALLAIGALPLSSWVSAYVQPDNVSTVLSTATLYVARRWQLRPDDRRFALGSGIFIGALFLVKQQYGFTLFVAIGLTQLAATIASRPPARRPRAMWLAAAAIPAVAGAALSFVLTPTGRLAAAQSLLASKARDSAHPFDPVEFLGRVAASASDALFGEGLRSFWFHFGFGRAAIVPPDLETTLATPAIVVTACTLALVAVAAFASLRRVARIARERSWRDALRLGLGFTPLTAYAVITTVLIVLSATSGGFFWLDGRYWLPVLPALATVVLVMLPRLLHGKNRVRAGAALAAPAAATSLAASLCGWNAIDRAFYLPPDPGPAYASRASIGASPSVVAGRPLDVRGFAIDSLTGRGADAVTCRLDGRSIAARTREPSPDLARRMNDEVVGDAGFDARVPGAWVTPGSHRLSCEVRSPGGAREPFEHVADVAAH